MSKNLRSLLNQCTQKRTGSHECLLCAGIDEYEPIHAPDCAVPAARAELDALEAENERLRAELAEADGRGWTRGMEEAAEFVADQKRLFTELAEDAAKRELPRQYLQRKAVASAYEMVEARVRAKIEESNQ